MCMCIHIFGPRTDWYAVQTGLESSHHTEAVRPPPLPRHTVGRSPLLPRHTVVNTAVTSASPVSPPSAPTERASRWRYWQRLSASYKLADDCFSRGWRRATVRSDARCFFGCAFGARVGGRTPSGDDGTSGRICDSPGWDGEGGGGIL